MSLVLFDLAYFSAKGVGYSFWYLYQGGRSVYYYLSGQESPEEIEAKQKEIEKKEQQKREADRIEAEQGLAKELALLRNEIQTLKDQQSKLSV